MNLLLIGAPGAGKGTISNYLIEKHGFKHISTGDILRQAVADQIELGLQAKEYMNSGKLVPDNLIVNLMKDVLSKCDTSKGIIFDGFPRTINQAYALDEMLSSLNLKLDKVLVLDIDDDILIKRITGRMVCSKCNSLYNSYFKIPHIEGKCDVCGSDLYKRKDDNLDSLNERLSEYHINAESLVSYYDKFNIVRHIDASVSSEEECDALEKTLKEAK